jgi:hypothetical protein
MRFFLGSRLLMRFLYAATVVGMDVWELYNVYYTNIFRDARSSKQKKNRNEL